MKGKHFNDSGNDIYSSSNYYRAKRKKPNNFSVIVKVAFVISLLAMIGGTVYIAFLHLLPAVYIAVIALAVILVAALQICLIRVKQKPNLMKTLSLILSIVVLFVSAFSVTMLGTVYGSVSKLPDENAEVDAVQADVSKEPFVVYLSGMDTRGAKEIQEKGLSDVNMVVVVNPVTSKILMVTIPRDYYVPLYGNSSKMDKLTHAGRYGVECSMSTLESLFDVKFNYYVKVNFKSVYDIVNALGGITVNSEYAFSSRHSYTEKVYTFVKGENQLDGDSALAFARERESFAAGDRQRGIHQQMIISAIIDKAVSPSILNPYKMKEVLDSVTSNTKTNISYGEISTLVKMQLSQMPSWKVESMSVDGTGDYQTTHSTGSQKVYVMRPNQSTVDAAKQALAAVLAEK